MSYCKRTKKWYPATEMVVVQVDAHPTKKELVGPEVETYICEDCGNKFIKSEIESYTTADGKLICGFCFDDWYCRCQDCDEIIPLDETYYINGIGNICPSCWDNGDYYECADCGELYHCDDIYNTDTGDYICYHCRENYYVCENCGRVIYSEDTYSDEDDEDTVYCRQCYMGPMLEDSRRSIHDYSYKPQPKFKRICNEKKTEEYFGFEIEVDGERGLAKDFLEAFGDANEEDLYLKRDGSVDGFEIVTQPMTRRYFKSKFVPKLDKGMAFLRKNGFRGHNRAGIHIHVSNNAITQQQLKKLMLLLYPEQDCIYRKWLAITQRHDTEMRSWARMDMEDTGQQKLYKTKTKQMKKAIANEINARDNANIKAKPYIGNSGRYTAINITCNTVEFRIFNSNIRTERIIKNAQVIFSLLDFTREEILPTFHNYMRYVEDNREKYKELWEFLLEKHIYIPRVNKQKTQEIVKAAQAIDSSIENYEDVIATLRNLNQITTEIDDNDETLATIQEGGAVCA